MRIVSRPAEAANAWEITVEGRRQACPGAGGPPARDPGRGARPVLWRPPARLKFLKTPRTERDLAVDTVRRLAMAYPAVAFSVTGDEERVLLRLPPRWRSAGPGSRHCSGRDFAENSVEIDAERGGFRLSGLAGLPTLNRALPRDQYLVVNGRPVRDKLLVGAVARRLSGRAGARPPSDGGIVFSTGPRPRSTSMSTRPRPRCGFATPGLVRGLIVGALRKRARLGRPSRLFDGRRRRGRGVPPGGPASTRRSSC